MAEKNDHTEFPHDEEQESRLDANQSDHDEQDDQQEENDLFEHFSLVVDRGQEPLRIDKFLTNRLEKVSRNRIQNAAKAGSILVNGSDVKPNYKVKPNDAISIVLAEPPREIELLPEDIPLDIVYEDKYLVVINKPSGLVVHPGYGNYTGTLVNALIHHFQNLPDPSAEQQRPGLVHRLDKETSGLMVIAKEEFTMTHLAKQFFDRTIKRTYNALVWGEPAPAEGEVEGSIGRDLRNRQKMTVFEEGEQGKYALTRYQLIKSYGYVSLVACKLATGRTHQIRVHMSHIGNPVFNDSTYGGDKIVKGTIFTKYKQFVDNCFQLMPRQALHAKSLGFIHPVTKKEIYFESELPQDFQAVLDKWERYTIDLNLKNKT